MGCHGHPYVQTPHLDAFYDEAVRFNQFHTGTTCAPTRSGLLTGHYCNSTGVWHTIGGRSLLRRDEWSLANALSDAGYRTALFGKWHLGDEYPYRPQDRGFQHVVTHGGGGVGQQPDYWGNDYFDDTYVVNGKPKAHQGYCTDVFFREALEYIRENKAHPFFCYLSTNAPHSPFNVEAKYRELYAHDTDNEHYARFLGMISNIDENFGRLRSTLQELDLEENTILIFMSDNGQTPAGDPHAYNSGMRGLKGSEYEGGHRVPFFLRWPTGGLAEGRQIETLTSYVDFMPTLLDLCGIEVPENLNFHGESLRPLMEGRVDAHWSERIITTDTQRIPYPLKWRMSCVMKDTWRLVNRTELYNLAHDPAQQHDVASDHPTLVKELQEAYEAWWRVCSERMQEDIPMSIGAETCPEMVLHAHDLRDDHEGSWICTQGQVRQGVPCSGWWEILVEQEGEYEFELRRWPEEAGHHLCSGIEGDDVVYRKADVAPGSEEDYEGGVALKLDTASLWISGLKERNMDVDPRSRGAVFRVQLPPGPRHVRARFSSARGYASSAYYVYVRWVHT